MKLSENTSILSNPLAWLFVVISLIVTICSLFTDKLLLSLVVPVAILGTLLIIKYPELAYFAIVALIPMNAFRVLSDAFPMLTVSKFLGIPLGFVIVLKIILCHERVELFKSKIFILLIFFTAVQVVTIFFTEWKYVVLDDVRKLFQTLIFVFLTAYFSSKPHFINKMVNVLIYSLTFSSVVSIIGSILNSRLFSVTFSETEDVRYTGTAIDPNYFAAMVLISLPLLLYKILKSPDIKWRSFYLIIMIINFYSILLTFSRSVYLVTSAVGIVLIIMTIKNIKKRYILPLLCLIVISLPIVFLLLNNMGVIDRVKTLSSFNLDPSLQRRTTYLLVAAEEFIKHPLLGYGPSTFKMLYSQSVFAPAFSRIPETYFRYAHNTYIEILIGSGIVGLLLFLLICLGSFLSLTKIEKSASGKIHLSNFLILSFFSFLLSFFFLSDLSHKYIWVFVGIAIFHEIKKNTKSSLSLQIIK